MNPFLDDGSGDLSALQDGTFPLNVASAVIGDTTPSQPLRTDASRKVISGLIQAADCAFTPLTNPATADLSLAGFRLTNAASITTPAANSNIIIGNTITNTGTANSNHVQIGAESSVNTAAYIGSTAVGYRASCTDNGAVAVGNTATAYGYAVAVGQSASATRLQNVAVGGSSLASGIVSTAVGADSVASGFQSMAIGKSAVASAANSITIGPYITNNTPNSCEIGDAAIASIYPASAICDLGITTARFKDLHASGSLVGTANTSAVNDVVTNAGTSVSGNIASLSGTTGKIITDSGVVAANVVTGPASAVTGRIVSYSGATGKLVADSGVLASSVVVGPASAVASRIAVFSGVTGKLLADGGSLIADLLAKSGGAMTGAIDSAATLSLGTATATALAIGRNAITTTINGIFTTPLPYASWYSTTNTLPSFVGGTWQAVAIVPSSSVLVDFTLNATTGALTYTGARTRQFHFTINANMSFTAASTFSFVVNKNPTSPPAGLINTVAAAIWDVTVTGSNRSQLVLTDIISLAQNDVIQICARWLNTSATEVTFGRSSFLIRALPN